MTIRFFSSRTVPGRASLLKFSRTVSRLVPRLRGGGEICVIFMSDKDIRKVNRVFLDHDRPTDVISFRYPPQKNASTGAPEPFGDIYISLDHVRRQAVKGVYPARKEAALLLVHGMLHLAGYRDDTRARQRIMFARQRALFRKAVPNLAPPDFR